MLSLRISVADRHSSQLTAHRSSSSAAAAGAGAAAGAAAAAAVAAAAAAAAAAAVVVVVVVVVAAAAAAAAAAGAGAAVVPARVVIGCLVADLLVLKCSRVGAQLFHITWVLLLVHRLRGQMAWPPWQPFGMTPDARGFPVPIWKHLLPEFPAVSRKVRLALPCIGADALGMGLREMSWDAVEIAYAWDVDPSLLPFLLAAHGPIGFGGPASGIGPSGNILKFDVASMERVDFLVTGPPCPPWSTIGRRASEDDVREEVFQKVTEIIEHQAELGCYGFILEMVPGIAHDNSHRHRGNGCMNYYNEWWRRLQSTAPMFRLLSWELQSSQYLPQNRVRLYTVGIHRAHAPSCGLVPPSPCGRRMEMDDFLHRGLCPIDEGVLTPQQRHNLSVMKQRLLPGFIGCGGPIACISVDRDPDLSWGDHTRNDGLVGTLRTRNELVWLFKADAYGRPVLSRCLHPAERFVLQGFRPEVAFFFSKVDGLRVSGNAFTVPVVTHVFQQLLGCFISPYALGFPDIPRMVHRFREPREFAELLHRARLINIERSQYAILERQLALLLRAM